LVGMKYIVRIILLAGCFTGPFYSKRIIGRRMLEFPRLGSGTVGVPTA